MEKVDEMQLKTVLMKDRMDLFEAQNKIVVKVWPKFMLNDTVSNKYFFRLYEDFPEYQYLLMQGEEIVGSGNSLPLFWDKKPKDLPDEGWDWALIKGFEDKEKDINTNVLCAISITINPKYQRKGISSEMVKAMLKIGKVHNLESLILPARPTLKKNYPLIPMKKYIHWVREDGTPFDPWLRVHTRLGAEIIKVCPKAMKIAGSISDWKNWTGMNFPYSGKYIIPEALQPIEFDVERDIGIYFDPNVWTIHRLKN